MKTLLLDNSGNVYTIVGNYTQRLDMGYFCKPMQWCTEAYDYVEIEEDTLRISEDETEIIDTNTAVIRMYKDRLLGFDTEQEEIELALQENEAAAEDYWDQQHLDYEDNCEDYEERKRARLAEEQEY